MTDNILAVNSYLWEMVDNLLEILINFLVLICSLLVNICLMILILSRIEYSFLINICYIFSGCTNIKCISKLFSFLFVSICFRKNTLFTPDQLAMSPLSSSPTCKSCCIIFLFMRPYNISTWPTRGHIDSLYVHSYVLFFVNRWQIPDISILR